MKRTFWVSLWVATVMALILMAFNVIGQEGVSSTSGTSFKPKIPPAPTLAADDLYLELGKAQATIGLQQKYISQLQSELAAAQALCQKPEKEEK